MMHTGAAVITWVVVLSALAAGWAPNRAAAAGAAPEAHTYTVTRNDDPAPDGCHTESEGGCSLREAVVSSNGGIVYT
jgi:hypothetical protein